MLDTICLIGRSSMFPFIGILCILVVPQNFPGHDRVGYNFLYSCSVNFDFIFLKFRWNLLSRVSGWSVVNFVNCFVKSHARHLPVYLYLSIKTTTLPLSWFRITMSFLFDSLDTISPYLYGNFRLQYFSHVFLSFIFILLSSFSGMCDVSLKGF